MGDLLEHAREVGEWARATLRHETPDNWHEFIETAPLDELVDLTVAYGVAVVWVPRASIVLELLATSTDSDRDQILVDHEAEILDDVEAVIAGIERPTLADPARATLEAVRAARDGHQMAGQASESLSIRGNSGEPSRPRRLRGGGV